MRSWYMYELTVADDTVERLRLSFPRLSRIRWSLTQFPAHILLSLPVASSPLLSLAIVQACALQRLAPSFWCLREHTRTSLSIAATEAVQCSNAVAIPNVLIFYPSAFFLLPSSFFVFARKILRVVERRNEEIEWKKNDWHACVCYICQSALPAILVKYLVRACVIYIRVKHTHTHTHTRKNTCLYAQSCRKRCTAQTQSNARRTCIHPVDPRVRARIRTTWRARARAIHVVYVGCASCVSVQCTAFVALLSGAPPSEFSAIRRAFLLASSRECPHEFARDDD